MTWVCPAYMTLAVFSHYVASKANILRYKCALNTAISSYTLKRTSSCNMYLLVDLAVLVALIAPFPSLTKGEKGINTRSMVCKQYALQIALCSLTYSSSFVVLLITVKLHGNPTGKSKTFSVFSNCYRAS